MIIKGTVEEIIFRNDANNYTVLVLNANGENVTCVGKFPTVIEGECLELNGNFVAHSRYGEQFSVNSVKLAPPTNEEGIIKYLSSGLIKGIGPITARSIVGKFGSATLDIIEYNPDRLSEVKGVSVRKAKEIAQCYASVRAMQNAIMMMQQYNISTNLAIKIYNYYGDKTESVLQNNPYKLVEDVDGIGFFTADRIAQSLGISADSQFRFRAGVLHLLKENSDKNGSTYIDVESVKSELNDLLQLGGADYSELFDDVIKQLEYDNQVVLFDKNNNKCIALAKYYSLEKYVAATLKVLNLNTVEKFDVDSEIDAFELVNNIKFHPTQRDTIKMAINSGVCVITGGPGTGKTTIIKCILYIFKSMYKRVKLLAPTGRAAKRMSEATGEEASTIHRALEVDYASPNMFKYNQLNKLPYDVIIVDEVSMVDIQLMFYLLRAVKHGSQVVFVGDKDQLPSVGAGNVLADILASNVIPNLTLTQIYRQSEDSLIITNAHAINNGKMPHFDNTSKDFFFVNTPNAEDALSSIIEMCVERVPKFLGCDSSHVQVLAPMKAGLCGIDNLNKCLQLKINPPSASKFEIFTEKFTYRVNDRVMQITNNYERVWTKYDGEQGTGVFNGDIGIITYIDVATSEVCVEFEDGRVVRYVKSDLGELTPSYAITIHKSQGSEFDCVIIPVLGGPPMLLTRNLLYTAVTRAKQMVVLIGTKQNIAIMVKNNHTQKRFTLLADFLSLAEDKFNE